MIPLGRFYLFIQAPAGNGKKVEIVELAKGSSLRSFAGVLESRGIVSSARLFALYARVRGGDARIKAGYYQFSDGMRPSQILDKMLAGDVYQRVFALPPGYSMYQVAEILEKHAIFRKEAFLEACRDRALLDQLGIAAPSVEGYLFPGSYNILPGRTEREVVREMVERQLKVLKGYQARAEKAGLPLAKLLTLASMVEKEAIRAEEKPTIAAVFQNRLRLRMRLQSDPTALYGIRAFAGKVSRQDILKPTPYNTYLIPGLPPGPIGNPASDTLEAVLNHPTVPYLYFVARGDGSHQFSSDLTAHNAAVRKFLRSSSTVSAEAP
ncbi:aminodeoxychorismate lyase [Geomonas limicola]|uniref:Endolytic murein transglycosylase n=2 Tax=Geomonas limicola TaxID=2740186 RepID=A0A6V8N7S2_9BACT|nr:aminodeoxychorismate lyase [Geomonas limicola]